MGFSFVHLLVLAGIVAVIFGPKPFQRAGASVGDFWRNLKRGYEGREDIEIEAKPDPEKIESPNQTSHRQ